MTADHLHKHARLPQWDLPDTVMHPYESATVILHRSLRKLSQDALRHRAVRLVAESPEFAVGRVPLRAGTAEEDALAAGGLRRRLGERRGTEGLIQEADIDDRGLGHDLML